MAARRIEFEDFIPYRRGLVRSVEIGRISRATGLEPYAVVGRLLDFWDWVSGQTHDGRLLGVWVSDLEATLGIPVDFWQATIDARWLVVTPDGLLIPNADRWITGAARARLVRRREEREKKRRQRLSAKTRGQSRDNRGTRAGHSGDASYSYSLSSSSEHSPLGNGGSSEQAGSKGKAVKRLPADFAFERDPVEVGRSCGLSNQQAAYEYEKLRDYEFKTARRDWNAVLRNWMRTAAERVRNGPRPGGYQTAAQRTFDNLREVLAEEEAENGR